MNLRCMTSLGIAMLLTACTGDDPADVGGEDTTGGDTTSAETTSPSTTNGTTNGTTGTTAPTTTTDPSTTAADTDENGDDETGTDTGTDDGLDETAGDETGSVDLCEDVQAEDDPCGACVCTECSDEMAACDADEGCTAIRECVIQSRCSDALECFEACGGVINMHGGPFGASAGLAQDLGDCVEASCSDECADE